MPKIRYARAVLTWGAYLVEGWLPFGVVRPSEWEAQGWISGLAPSDKLLKIDVWRL